MAGDDALVARARTGDEAAWAELYARHARRLEAWLRTLPTGDTASAAEDVAAEAWLTAAAKIGEFRGDADDFAGWLFGISRKLSANRRRTAQRRATAPIEVEADDAVWGSVPDATDQVLGEDGVRRLLQHLSPREAEVVACIDVAGLDVAATAAALGMRPTAVRVARHRALGRLRTVLGSQSETESETQTPRPL